ncbi:uncharacterized protein LOC144700791 isoform X4 [Wolffia australiana]
MKTQARRCTCWGIPYYSTEDESFFQGCGTVTELDCMIFRENGKFTGIAIVSFKMEAATKRALALGCSDSEGPEAWVRGVDLEGQPGEGGCELHLAGYHHEPPRAVWQRVRAGAGLPHVTHRRSMADAEEIGALSELSNTSAWERRRTKKKTAIQKWFSF